MKRATIAAFAMTMLVVVGNTSAIRYRDLSPKIQKALSRFELMSRVTEKNSSYEFTERNTAPILGHDMDIFVAKPDHLRFGSPSFTRANDYIDLRDDGHNVILHYNKDHQKKVTIIGESREISGRDVGRWGNGYLIEMAAFGPNNKELVDIDDISRILVPAFAVMNYFDKNLVEILREEPSGSRSRQIRSLPNFSVLH